MSLPKEISSTRKGGEGRNLLGTDEFRSGVTKMHAFLTARVVNPMPEKAQFRAQHSIAMVVGHLTKQGASHESLHSNTESQVRPIRKIYIRSLWST